MISKGEVIVKLKESDIALLVAAGIGFVLFKQANASEYLPIGDWMPPVEADPYLSTINQTSRDYDLPQKLLARVLYQESRFRQDIINGTVQSSAGAQGIAQIVPKWHPDVNPLDPIASIKYAGKYLKQLYGMFGNWEDALAAYNWGMGNVRSFKSGLIASMPTETRNYITDILTDIA